VNTEGHDSCSVQKGPELVPRTGIAFVGADDDEHHKDSRPDDFPEPVLLILGTNRIWVVRALPACLALVAMLVAVALPCVSRPVVEVGLWLGSRLRGGTELGPFRRVCVCCHENAPGEGYWMTRMSA